MPVNSWQDRAGQKKAAVAPINLPRIRKLVADARTSALQDGEAVPAGIRPRAAGTRPWTRHKTPGHGLSDYICGLAEDEQIVLVALAWIGRGTYGPAEWQHALAEARNAQCSRTCEYLMSLPQLACDLELGLKAIEASGQFVD